MEFKSQINIFKLRVEILVLVMGSIFVVESLNSVVGQTVAVTPSNQATVSNAPDWSNIDDSEWVKEVGHMLLQPLLKEEINMVCKQMGLSSEIQTDLLNFNDLITQKDSFGRESSRAAESEAIHNSGSELSSEFEKQYEEAKQQCLELAKKLRAELGDKQEDVIEWILERDYIRGMVMDASFKKELTNEEDLTNKAIQTIEQNPGFIAYKVKKSSKFSNPEDANNYFSQHELSLQKRLAYQILKFSGREYKGASGRQEYKSKMNELVQEITAISQ
jgi:hypothetical protein